MNRLRFIDIVSGGLPEAVGLCQNDLPRLADYVNRSQERLLLDAAAGEEGWWGGHAEITFAVSRRSPFLTAPRGVARLLALDACSRPIPLRNQLYEYLQFGDGRLPNGDRWVRSRRWGTVQGYGRNNACVFQDITNPPQKIQVFPVNPLDAKPSPNTGAIPRIFIQGYDQNGNIVTSQDNGVTVQGEFIQLAAPYAMSVNSYSFLTGIQKDFTQGEVQVWQSDPIWGVAELLSVIEPTETTPWYRRYEIGQLPARCCPALRPIPVNPPPATCGCPYEIPEYVQIQAIAKLDLIPVMALTDYCLIQSKEAIILEAQAVRFSNMDSPAAVAKAASYHADAIKILRGQKRHTEGSNTVSVNFRPFGSASLRKIGIGMT